FEVFDKNPANPRALCGGGAFANLLSIFGEDPLPGVGFGLGDVTLKDFLEVHGLLPDFSLPSNDAFIAPLDEASLDTVLELANSLREHGLNVFTSFEALKFKKLFPLAEKRGASFV